MAAESGFEMIALNSMTVLIESRLSINDSCLKVDNSPSSQGSDLSTEKDKVFKDLVFKCLF